jgi:hypothetical protein
MADGAVRFVNNSINAALWRGIGTMNNKETVTNF